MLKVARLVVAVLMIISIIFYLMAGGIYDLPSQDLVMTALFSMFVFLLGLQYHLEKKQNKLGLFFMMFAVMMLIMTVIGFTF